jgi:hypothetical protein
MARIPRNLLNREGESTVYHVMSRTCPGKIFKTRIFTKKLAFANRKNSQNLTKIVRLSDCFTSWMGNSGKREKIEQIGDDYERTNPAILPDLSVCNKRFTIWNCFRFLSPVSQAAQ